jgi:hypothetical protein
MAISTIYAPQRVGYKPAAPYGMASKTPREMLLEQLKALGDKRTQAILDQSPAAVMGALTNPPDVAPGLRSLGVGDVGRRAAMMGGA